MKTMRIKMTDANGNAVYWSVKRIEQAVQLVLGRRPRRISGWSFTDHEGYERFSEGNWINFVPEFHRVARNYGFTSNLS